MPSPEERRQLETVNGLRGPVPPWTKKPTMITIPRNSTSIYQSQSKGGNPFALNLNNRSRQSELNVGDKISRSNLTGILREDDGARPPKRRRTDRDRAGLVDYTYSSGGVHISPNRSSSSRPPLAPDTVTIVEHDNHEAELNEERSSTKHRRPSPDELNIASQPSTGSKYPFSRQSTLAQRKHKTSHIVPDGSDTERAMEKYRVEGSDDPIEDPDEPMPTSKGPVRQEVERLDQIHTHSPKIDLARMQKPLNKARSMKTKHIKLPDSRVKRNTTNPDALQFDRVAVSQTLLTKEHGPLPIEEAYLEDGHLSHSKGKKLQMFWDSNAVSVRIDEKEVYRLWLTPATCETVTYSETSKTSPVIQLKPVNGQSFVTIRFNIKDPDWSLKLYEKFTKMASKVAKVETIKNPEAIWDLACRLSGDNSAATSEPNEPTRLEILQGIQDKKKASLPLGTRKRKGSFLFPPSSPLTNSPSSPETTRESKPTSKAPVYNRRENKPTVTDSNANLRRSTRNAPSEKTQTKGSDELILVYPPGPGAVNITQGDLNRLGPEEYLNDTLIEFGLKMWLKNLSEQNPVLASKIHIFNSFFYKKLNHSKDVQQAFESVKKWTSKFDIFEKKYVIVPINEHFHWYLAIICEPEHVLSRRSSRSSRERKTTRSTAQAEVSVSGAAPSQNDNEDERDDQNVTSSEAEVERNLNHEFQSSCTVETHDFDPGMPFDATDDDDAQSLKALSYVTDDGEEFQRSKIDDLPSTSASMRPGESRDKNVSPTPSSVDMVVDSTEETSALPNHVPIPESDSLQPQSRVKNGNGKGKGKDAPGYDIVMMENDIEGTASTKSQQRTYIFIMDSLGTRHPQAVRKLSKYLVMEAQDKKGISDAAEAEGRFASVPVQPNFCDCGLYLLHFAQTFMTDPSFYTECILSQAKHIPNQTRQQTWNDNQVAQMRNELGQKIRQLSESWKKERKGDEGEKPPDCDDDIEIVSDPETEKKQAMMSAKNGKNQSSKVNRLRG